MMKMSEPGRPDATRTIGDSFSGVRYQYYGRTSDSGQPFAWISAETYADGVARVDAHIERADDRWAALTDARFVAEIKRILRERAAALVGA